MEHVINHVSDTVTEETAEAPVADYPGNPKKLYGDKKPAIGLLPALGQLAQWEAQQAGALKYGEYNWRTNPVEAMTYVHAIRRHLELYTHGESVTRDTRVSNLGAIMASCAILIDAEAHGALIDNRPVSEVVCDSIHHAEQVVERLRDSVQGVE